MNNTTVSIVIPTYTHPQWLGQALASSLMQTYKPVEIIVVSDGPQTTEAIQAVARYPDLHFLQQDHSGAGVARNTGLAASKGEFIQFLDDDDWLEPEAISAKMDVFKLHPDIGIVYSDIYLTSIDGITLGKYYDGFSRPLPCGDILKSLIKRNCILVHSPLWRRSVLIQAGGFPGRTGAEDWELLVRCAEFTKFEYIDRPLGYYRLHNQNATLDYKRQIKGEAAVQSYVVTTSRFNQVSPSNRARILSGYAFQQWLNGNAELGIKFYEMARKANPMHLYPIILKIMMLLGRPIVQPMMRLIWKIRSMRRPSSAYYFLNQREN